MKRIKSAWWSLQPENGWVVQYDPECVTLTSPDGTGALQLSAARKESGAIGPEDIREFAQETLGNDPGSSANHAGFSGVSCLRTVNGNVWSYYWLARDSIMVFATYNRPVQQASTNRDIADVESMLNSLQLEPAA